MDSSLCPVTSLGVFANLSVFARNRVLKKVPRKDAKSRKERAKDQSPDTD